MPSLSSKKQINYSVGVDEAGRGALAGPVVAAAVLLDPDLDDSVFKDSKQCHEKKRDHLFDYLIKSKSRIGVGVAGWKTIDRTNIRLATLAMMRKAIQNLRAPVIDHIIIDGNDIPSGLSAYHVESLVQGDRKLSCISAASIVAKVVRDRLMIRYHYRYPQYQFNKNKGYGTESHYDALFSNGPSKIHRKTFNLARQERLFDT